MSRAFWFAGLAALLLAPAAYGQSDPPAAQPLPNGAIAWMPFDEALSSAQVNDEKVLVFVYTQWCGWCRKMLESVFTDDEVNAYMNEAFATVWLDAEGTGLVKVEAQTQDGQPIDRITEAQLAQALGAQGFPTTIFMKSDGEYITRLPSYLPAEDYLHVLRYIGDDHFLTQSFDDYLAGVKGDAPDESR